MAARTTASRRLRGLSAQLCPAPTGVSGLSELSRRRQEQARAAPSSCTLTVDLDAVGKQWGSIVVPWSDDTGAWANKLVPICVVNGPTASQSPDDTALLFAGTQ